MFSKRHYEDVAEAIQHAVGAAANDEQKEGAHLAMRFIAANFGRDNPHFDRERFLRACIPGANVRARKCKS